MALTGDTEKLARVVSQLQTVGEVPKAARTLLAKDALGRVQALFASSKSPDGTAWKELKYRVGKPLVLSGKLSKSFTASVTGDGFVVTAGVPYAVHHQFGAPRANVDARPFFPRDGVLPGPWRDAFERLIDQTLSAHFR